MHIFTQRGGVTVVALILLTWCIPCCECRLSLLHGNESVSTVPAYTGWIKPQGYASKTYKLPLVNAHFSASVFDYCRGESYRDVSALLDFYRVDSNESFALYVDEQKLIDCQGSSMLDPSLAVRYDFIDLMVNTLSQTNATVLVMYSYQAVYKVEEAKNVRLFGNYIDPTKGLWKNARTGLVQHIDMDFVRLGSGQGGAFAAGVKASFDDLMRHECCKGGRDSTYLDGRLMISLTFDEDLDNDYRFFRNYPSVYSAINILLQVCAGFNLVFAVYTLALAVLAYRTKNKEVSLKILILVPIMIHLLSFMMYMVDPFGVLLIYTGIDYIVWESLMVMTMKRGHHMGSFSLLAIISPLCTYNMLSMNNDLRCCAHYILCASR
jgi:hypothetical protein